MLEWAPEEMSVKTNQFGRAKGCSGTHMLINVWQKILYNLEDRRAPTVLTSIDYAKAFNRLSFQHCLMAFSKRGASSPIIELIASFLTGKTMSVRVGSTWSNPCSVNGGCPQGSILRVFLFNLTTDDLEDESEYVDVARRIDPPDFDCSSADGTTLAALTSRLMSWEDSTRATSSRRGP